MQPEQHVAIVLGPPDPQVEAVVHLLVDKRVGGLVTPHPVAPQLVGAHGFVHPHVEHGGVVVGPGHAIGRVLEGLGRHPPALELDEPHGVPLAAGRVGGVGQPAVVRADLEVPHGEVLVSLSQLVLVEQDLLVGGDPFGGTRSGTEPAPDPAPAPAPDPAPDLHRPVGRPPAVDPVAAALDGTAVVEPGALLDRHRQVRLLDPGHHLVEQGLAEPGGAGHGRLGVGILGLEVRDHRRVVLVPQPVPVVDTDVPMGLEPLGAPLGARRGHSGRVGLRGRSG